jgi:uncharacterized repeat protein (TIGR01451 family)
MKLRDTGRRSNLGQEWVKYWGALTTDAGGQATGSVTSTVVGMAQIGAVISDTFSSDTLISNTVTITFAGSDLVIIKTGPAEAGIGQIITYSLTVRNDGLMTANQVILTDTLPAGVSYVTHTASVEPSQIDNQVIWTLGDLAYNASLSFDVVGQVTDTVTLGQSLVNQAQVASDSFEENPADNSATFTTTIRMTDLAVTKSGPAQAAIGQSILYNLSVENLGPAPAEGVVVTDILPASIEYLAHSAPVTPTINGSQVTWELGSLGGGESLGFALMGRVTETIAPGETVQNVVQVSSLTPDEDTQNNAFTTTAQVIAPYSHTLTLDPATVTARLGATQTLRLRIANTGPLALLTHSTLTETLASYTYALDAVGNRTVLTETLMAVLDVPGAYLETGGLAVLEAERFGQVLTSPTHAWVTMTAQSGYTGTAYLQALPDLDALVQTDEITGSPRAEYAVYFTTPGTYTVWVRGLASNAAGDSLYLGLGGQVTGVTGFAPGTWDWASVTPSGGRASLAVETAGTYTISLWMREDGLRVDRLLLVTDTAYIPAGFGPAESGRQAAGGPGVPAVVDRVIDYGYDDLYRLTSADYSTGEASAYDYDPAGNRLQQSVNGEVTSYQYDAANRLTSVNGQPYTWDANPLHCAAGTMRQPVEHGCDDQHLGRCEPAGGGDAR